MMPWLPLAGMGGFTRAPAPSGRRYWRISISANNGDASFTVVQEVEFRLVAAGADVTTTSTPVTASSTLGVYRARWTTTPPTTSRFGSATLARRTRTR
jgi:hypothetical protein